MVYHSNSLEGKYMKCTLEQVQRKKKPLVSLRAPLCLARRESNLKTQQQYRTEFMRDRDRILYSKSFRRLAGKTQVYLFGVDDHRRTRLTHTLEVSQIARSIAAPLKLDTDLVEAISLGHDLGHTPFGHVGERTLHEIMTPQTDHVLGDSCPLYLKDKDAFVSDDYLPYLGFKHNLQSLKNAMRLEKNYGDYGLDLTCFTLYGLQDHSKSQYKFSQISNHNRLGYYDSFKKRGCTIDGKQYAWSLESLVVAEADEIAQYHHDVEDAIRGKLISKEEIVSIIKTNFSKFLRPADKRDLNKAKNYDEETFIAIISRILVNMFVTRLINASVININTFIFKENLTQKTFANYLKCHNPDEDEIKQLISYGSSPEGIEFTNQAKAFQNTITNRVLSSYDIQTADAKGKYIIKKIFQAYYATPQQLPNHCVYEFLSAYKPECYSQTTILEMVKNEGIGKVRNIFSDLIKNLDNNDYIAKLTLMRIICDFIAGMTDSFAQKTYEDLYG